MKGKILVYATKDEEEESVYICHNIIKGKRSEFNPRLFSSELEELAEKVAEEIEVTQENDFSYNFDEGTFPECDEAASRSMLGPDPKSKDSWDYHQRDWEWQNTPNCVAIRRLSRDEIKEFESAFEKYKGD